MMYKNISPLGLIFAAGYAGGIYLCRYYSWHCSGQHCMYVLVIPFLPWAIWLERWVHHGNAVMIYVSVAALNGTLAYLAGTFVQQGTGRLWRWFLNIWKRVLGKRP